MPLNFTDLILLGILLAKHSFSYYPRYVVFIKDIETPVPRITANNLINRMHKKGASQIVVPLVFSWNYESMQLSVQ